MRQHPNNDQCPFCKGTRRVAAFAQTVFDLCFSNDPHWLLVPELEKVMHDLECANEIDR